MTALHIALHDGFAGDEVVIRVDGREVYNRAGVKTDLRISRADGLDVEAADAATVEVRARGHAATAQVDPRATPNVAVSIDPQGEVQIRASAEPFAYL